MSRSKRHRNRGSRYFATTALGLERVLTGELRRLGITSVKTVAGGVSFTGTRRELMRACLNLRTAHRVLWSIVHFEADSPDALYTACRRRVRWESLIPDGCTISVYATCRESAIQHSHFAALRIKDAIVDELRDRRGHRPSVDPREADIRIRARISRNQVTLSLDAAGVSLDRRGYRLDGGPAPLRESLAAGLLEMSGWRGERPLIDPMCGSGTIPIEASAIACAAVPGLSGRSYAFEKWPGHRPELLEALRQEAAGAVRSSEPQIYGSDVAAGAIARARKNHARAGYSTEIAWRRGGVEELVNPCPGGPPGVLLGNPPYGERISDARAVERLYHALGDRLRAQFSGWECWLLVSEPGLDDAIGLEVGRRFMLKNGALDVAATQFLVP